MKNIILVLLVTFVGFSAQAQDKKNKNAKFIGSERIFENIIFFNSKIAWRKIKPESRRGRHT